MPLTFAQLKDHATHALKGGAPSSTLPTSQSQDATVLGQIVNEAGRAMYAHAWNFRIAGADVGFVADVSHASLPHDFGEVHRTNWKSGLVNYFAWRSIEEIRQARRLSLTSDFYFIGAIAYTDSDSETGLTPRIELYPTPGETNGSALILDYFRTWRELVASTDRPAIPVNLPHLERLLVEYVRQYAMSYDDDDIANVTERLAMLESSPLFANARKADGRVQRVFGVPMGGYVDRPETERLSWYENPTISDPA